MRSLLPSIASLPLLTLLGCMGPGQPWGVLDASLEGEFAPSEERLDDQGRLKTNLSYGLDIESIHLEAGLFTLALASEGDLGSFDPARAPEGYSLCHNGHCHRDDGALIDYEDIAAELAGTAAAAAPGIGLLALSSPDTLGTDPLPYQLEDCGECQLPRGELDTLSLGIAAIEVQARVYDISNQERLPEDGVPLSLAIDLEGVTILTFLDGAIERGYEPGLTIEATLSPGDAFLDNIDFGDLSLSEDGSLDLGGSAEDVDTLEDQLGQLDVNLSYFSLTP